MGLFNRKITFPEAGFDPVPFNQKGPFPKTERRMSECDENHI